MLVSLDGRSTAHVIGRLREGRTLSRTLAYTVETVAADISALLPEGSDVTRVLDFESGTVAPSSERIILADRALEPVVRPYAELIELLRRALSEQPDRVCLAEHYFATPSSEFLKTVAVPTVTFNDEVYFVLSLEHLLQSTIRLPLSWHFALAVSSSIRMRRTIENLTADDIASFARSATLIVIGAYDGSGLLIWRRR